MKPEINVTPLIDVLLVLLIIFMVVSPVKPSMFEARIPVPSSAMPEHNPPGLLVVTINKDRTIELNSKAVGSIDAPRPLSDKLREVFDLRKEQHNRKNGGVLMVPADKFQRTVFIKAAHRVAYGDVVSIIDTTKAAGAHPISLQIDRLD